MKPKRILSLLLTAALALGLLALAPITASAADIGIGFGDDTSFQTNTATPAIVNFGGKQWAVIGCDGTGVASDPGTITLLLANGQTFGTSAFKAASPYNNEYFGSALIGAMETAFNGLNTKEKALVAGRDFAGGAVYNDNSDKVAGTTPVTDAKFWPLSVNEAKAVNREVRKFSNWWWLRSPGDHHGRAALVDDDGPVDGGGRSVDIGDGGVRPALLLNLASVLFASDASGASAKSSAAVGGGLMPAKRAGQNLKFTFLDSSLKLGNVTVTSKSGNTVNFTYSGATPGKTLSAVVVNYGALKYYGKLVASTAASGTASVTLPGDFGTGGTERWGLWIFVEEANGDNQSDFASAEKQLVLSPALTSGSVNRTSDTAATINFTANMEGTAYYAVLDSGVAAPSAALVKSGGTSLGIVTAGAVTGKPVTLTAGAKDIYVVLENTAVGAISAPLKIQAAAFGAPTPTLTLSASTWSPAAAAASTSVSVTSNTSWTASSDASAWLTVAPASGSNNGTLTINAAANTGTASRSGTVTVAGGGIIRTVAVTQSGTAAATYTLTINGNGVTIAPATVTQAQGTNYTLPTPTRDGYTFTGWTLSGGGSLSGSTYTFGTANGTVTAGWTQNSVDTTKYIKLWGKTTKYVSNFGNWLLCIICFGWIWMAF